MAFHEGHPLLGEQRNDELSQEDMYLSKVQNRNLYLATFAAVLGALSYGFVMGYSSPAIPDLQRNVSSYLRLDEVEAEWFGSTVPIGAAIGTFFGMWLINTIGRKLTLVLCSLPFMFGYTIIVASPNVWALCSGRFLTGVATGVTSLVVPIYVTEIAHTHIRGTLNSCVQLMVAIGIGGAYIAGVAFTWRWLAVLGCLAPFTMLLSMAFMPETPQFLLTQEKRSEAVTALQFLRGPNVDHEWECNQIEESIRGDQFHTADYKNPAVYKPLFIGALLMVFQQLTGISAIIFYAEIIFEEAKFMNSSLAAVTVGVIHLFFTVVAILVVDKAGRKKLLIVSGILMAASSAFLVAYFKLRPSPSDVPKSTNPPPSDTLDNMDWLAISSVGAFVAGFAIGWGPIPWLVMSEIFPLTERSVATGFCIITNWGFAFLITMECFDLMDALTCFGTFLLFSGFCVLGIIFTIVFVPETKG